MALALKILKKIGKVILCIASYPIVIVGGLIYAIVFGLGHLLGECIGILEPLDPDVDNNPFRNILPMYAKILCEDD